MEALHLALSFARLRKVSQNVSCRPSRKTHIRNIEVEGKQVYTRLLANMGFIFGIARHDIDNETTTLEVQGYGSGQGRGRRTSKYCDMSSVCSFPQHLYGSNIPTASVLAPPLDFLALLFFTCVVLCMKTSTAPVPTKARIPALSAVLSETQRFTWFQ